MRDHHFVAPPSVSPGTRNMFLIRGGLESLLMTTKQVLYVVQAMPSSSMLKKKHDANVLPLSSRSNCWRYINRLAISAGNLLSQDKSCICLGAVDNKT